MGWRGRQEGGSGWGTHVNPWLIHVNVWQKPLQYCKVISLQLIKINEKKIKIKLLRVIMVLKLRDEGKCPCFQEIQAKVFMGEVHDRHISYVNKERYH